jgi:hypothetical protein
VPSNRCLPAYSTALFEVEISPDPVNGIKWLGMMTGDVVPGGMV